MKDALIILRDNDITMSLERDLFNKDDWNLKLTKKARFYVQRCSDDNIVSALPYLIVKGALELLRSEKDEEKRL